MASNSIKIPKFMTEKKEIWLFLFATLLFAILFVLVYQPAGYMRTPDSLSNWNKQIYTAIQFFAGFVILTISRFLFRRLHIKKELTIRDMVIWIAGELVVISLSLTLIATLINADENLEFYDLLGRVSFNITTILVIPYAGTTLILMLRERRQQIEALKEYIEKQEEQQETNENINFYALGGKLAFSTRSANVLYIEAADNYSNIHYLNEGKEDTFILHNSLKNLDNEKKYPGLLRCHRGYMVNIDNVKLLRKEKDGLVIELTQGGKPIPVSRTYNERVVKFFAGER
jgi:DNA-binding LytR/AlgR family response regulator